MSKNDPQWLQEARRICRGAGIQVSGWGPDTLMVEARSPDRATQIAAQLRQLGLEPVENEDDAEAGLLLLSRNPAATRAREVSFDVSRRPSYDQIEPMVLGACSIGLLASAMGDQRDASLNGLMGIVCVAFSVWEGCRIWGWRLEMLPEGIRVRRRFRWSTIPWEQVRAVDAVPGWARTQEVVVLKLEAHASERLGMFNFPFARILRDRLRAEIKKQSESKQVKSY